MNVELARRVLERITSEPESHLQAVWAHRLGAGEDNHPIVGCGTTLCVAGWAHVLNGGQVFAQTMVWGESRFLPKEGWFEAGQRALDISDDEAFVLFFTEDDDEAVALLSRMIADAEAGVTA